MLFNSFEYLIFLPLVFFIYWRILEKSLRWQNFFILVASYFFYGWWDWRFLFLIAVSSAVDYIAGLRIHHSTNVSKRRIWFGISLAANLGMLGFFKYYNFFVDSFITAFSDLGFTLSRPTLQIILPVGISFYTFQTLSYSIDIYRRRLEPTKDLVAFLAYVSFFPQLVAGPIERASHLLPQFLKKRIFDSAFAATGMRIMLWGFFKKVVIADNLAPLVDQVYSNPSGYSGIEIAVAGIFFTIQIYCDFSGYSDMAIGAGRLFGFDLMTNFRTPYFSRTMAEFWTRWHISLSTWFRDYVYIPLGGNKVSNFKWSLNILIVFVVSGLWHGANWTFVIWGFLNALYLIFGRFTAGIREKANNLIGLREETIVKKITDAFIVTSLFGFALVIFRADNFQVVKEIFARLFTGLESQLTHPLESLELLFRFFGSSRKMLIVVVSILILFIVDLLISKDDFAIYIGKKPAYLRGSVYISLFIWIFLFGAFARPEAFVYFQF